MQIYWFVPKNTFGLVSVKAEDGTRAWEYLTEYAGIDKKEITKSYTLYEKTLIGDKGVIFNFSVSFPKIRKEEK